MVICWFCEIEKFPIYSMKGTEKAGVLCIYGMWMLCVGQGWMKAEGWNLRGSWDECLMWTG